MKYRLINKEAEQCDLLYQLEMQNNWEDPVAIHMELWFSENSILAEFGMKEHCGYKYSLQKNILLQMLTSYLISICMQKVIIVGWILSWLHWKYDYTLLVCFVG